MRTAPALAAAWLLAPATAGGQEPPPPVAFTMAGCEGLRPAEVRRVLSVELGGAPTDGGGGRDGVRATVVCEGDAARIEVTATSGPPVRRELDLAAEPVPARERVLAVAVAETVAAGLAAATRPSPGGDLPEDGPPGAAAGRDSRTPPEEAPREALGVTLSARGALFWSDPWLGGGGGAALAHRIGGYLAWGLDVDAAASSRSASLGRVDFVAASAAPWLGTRLRAAFVGFDFDAGFRIGFARLEGVPDDPSGAAGSATFVPWGGPFAALGVTAFPVEWLALGVRLETGYSLFAFRGGIARDPDVELAGAWVLAQVSAGVAL